MPTTDFTRWLTTRGFTKNPDFGPQDVYDNGTARVVIEDAEAEAITVYRFTNDRARLLEWEAEFRHAPTPVITAAAQAALAPEGGHWSGALGRHVTIPD